MPKKFPSPSMARASKSQHQLLADFRHAMHGFLQFSGDAARQVGLTPQQHQTLLAIKGAAADQLVTIGYLAQRLHLKHHSAVGQVDRLEKRGLVRRQPSAADRRRVEVSLTTRGEALITRLSAAHHEELRRRGPALHRALQLILDE